MAPFEGIHQKRDTNITIRLRPAERDLIDQAAELVGKSRSEFVLESARREAEAVLLDHCLFRLDTAKVRQFMKRLDSPPATNEQLRALLSSKAPWD